MEGGVSAATRGRPPHGGHPSRIHRPHVVPVGATTLPPCAVRRNPPRLCPRASPFSFLGYPGPILPFPYGGGQCPLPPTRPPFHACQGSGRKPSPALRWTSDDDHPRADSLLEGALKNLLWPPLLERSGQCCIARHKTWAKAMLSSCLVNDDYVLGIIYIHGGII